MRWPWRHRPQEPMPAGHDRSVQDAERRLLELLRRQHRVDELEEWAERELRENNFSRRIRQALEGR